MSQWACSSCGKELPSGDSTGTVSSVCPSCGGKLVRMEKVNLSAEPGSSPPDEGGEYDVTRKLAAKSAMKGAQPADPDSPTKTSDRDRGADGRPRDAGAKPAAEAAGAADPEGDPLVGRILGGCEILSVVGRGAMGTVYEAKQLSLDRTVAVKTIRRDYVTDKQFLQRFRQEARTVGRFNTPYVVQIHEVGFDQGYHYLVMELVRGGNLRSYVASQRERALTTTDALQFLSQAAEGLLQAEKLKIIHRDIKPGNLLVDPNGRLKITDFGIAKMLESDTQITMTGTNDVIGTPLYMSPEQVEGGPIDHRSDMYSLGATFFHLLTGTPPVEGDSFYEVIKRKSLLPSLSPRRMLKESRVPAEVSTVIEKMTALRAADRYPSFQDLLDDIARVREGRKIEPPAHAAQGAKKPVPLGRSQRTLVSAGLAVGILAVVGYSFIPWRTMFGSGTGEVVEKRPEEKASVGGTAVVSAGSTGSANGGQTPAATRSGNGGGTEEKSGPSVVMPVTVGTGSGGGESAVPKVEPAREDQRLGATLENLKARFVQEGPVKTVLDDATAFRAQVGGMSESELQNQAKSFLDDIDECRSIGDSLRSRPVDAVDVTPPFEAVARHWSSVNPVLQPPSKAGPELKLWIQSERSKRLEALEKKVIPSLQALVAEAETAKKSYLEWEITPEAYREAMDRVMASKARLMEALPEKKDVWDAALTGAVITSLQDVSSRTEVDRSIKEIETSATKLLSEITAAKSGSDWKPELAERVGKEAEAIGSALRDIQAKHAKAPVTPAVTIWKEVDERRGKWAGHMKAMEEAVAALQPGKLDGAAEKIQALEATGVSDPAAEKLRAGRQAILDGFQVLFSRLDTIAAGAQFAAAEEKLRDFPAAAQYAAKLRDRAALFREKSSSMAPVQAGDVDPPDRKPLTRVDAFFIDRTEVSVREFEQFEAAMARAKYEDVRRLWPTEALFSKFRTLPEYLRRGDIDPSWPIEEVNYYQARAYALWREKDILTLEEWWLAARGPIRGGTVRITAPNTIESKNPERPVRVDLGGVAVAFPTTYRVHHLSGNVAEWCRVDAGATTAPLVGGRYADSTAKKLQGEVPDNSPLGDSRRGYGFRCVLRPADFFAELLPAPPKKPGGA